MDTDRGAHSYAEALSVVPTERHRFLPHTIQQQFRQWPQGEGYENHDGCNYY